MKMDDNKLYKATREALKSCMEDILNNKDWFNDRIVDILPEYELDWDTDIPNDIYDKAVEELLDKLSKI
jgi:hypothetical protein